MGSILLFILLVSTHLLNMSNVPYVLFNLITDIHKVFMTKFIVSYLLSILTTLGIGVGVYMSSGNQQIQVLGNVLIFSGILLGFITAYKTATQAPASFKTRVLITSLMIVGTIASFIGTALIIG